MDDVTPFEERFGERLRAFAGTGVQSVDSTAVARAVAAEHPRSAATRPQGAGRRGLHRTRQRAVLGPWRTRSILIPSLATAAVIAVLVAGALLVTRSNQPAISDPSPSLPGVVAPSSTPTTTPSATTPNPSAFPRTTGVWIATGSMGTPRAGHTAVRLIDGRVLVVGDFPGDYPESAVASAELYDPESGTWSAAASMLNPHAGLRATLLQDGRVLVGDVDNRAADYPLMPVMGAEVYDPATGTWTATGKMVNTVGQDRSATLLRDGRVLVVGSGSAELYDPASGTWAATGQPTVGALIRPSPILLPDGKVLVAGGGEPDPHQSDAVELYDPDAGTWSATGTMGTPRFGHTTVGLLDGRVLVVGGGHDDSNDTSAELYDPESGTWSATGSMLKPHKGFRPTLLRDGRVLVGDIDGAELFDPGTGTWTITGSMLQGHDGAPATLLLDGTVLVAGGATGLGQLYVPAGVSPPVGLPTAPDSTPIPTPTPSPTPMPPQAGPVPPGARTWKVTVVNRSSEPATLFVAEEDTSGMARLVGSVTPNVVPAGATVEVTFRLPAKGVEGWWIFVNPGPDNGALLAGTDVPRAGEIRITADGQVGWLSP